MWLNSLHAGILPYSQQVYLSCISFTFSHKPCHLHLNLWHDLDSTFRKAFSFRTRSSTVPVAEFEPVHHICTLKILRCKKKQTGSYISSQDLYCALLMKSLHQYLSIFITNFERYRHLSLLRFWCLKFQYLVLN